MANTIQYNDMQGKRNWFYQFLMSNWFYLTHLCLLIGGLEPELILYTSHLLASFNLGGTPVKLMEETVAWMLDWQAVWEIPFFICRMYRGFGVSE